MGAMQAVRHLGGATCSAHDSHVTVRQAFLSGPHSHEAHLYIHYISLHRQHYPAVWYSTRPNTEPRLIQADRTLEQALREETVQPLKSHWKDTWHDLWRNSKQLLRILYMWMCMYNETDRPSATFRALTWVGLITIGRKSHWVPDPCVRRTNRAVTGMV